jgi:putative DNA primase/helicase
MSSFDKPDTDDKGRLKVSAGNRNPIDVADEVATHLLKANKLPQLFSMGMSAAVLLKDDGRLLPLDADGWLAYVARRATFTAPTTHAPRIIAPPAAVMKLIPSVVIPDLPELDGVATTPYLDADGTVVDADGYNPGTRLVLHMGGLGLPQISEHPSEEEVAGAVRLLTKDWLGDFSFSGEADKANAIATLLTLTGRPFFGLAPLFVVDASTPGSGKGLLVTTLALVATGEPPHFLELPGDGEEQRKKVTSALLAGHALIAWDESHVIAGRTLAMILTAERYSDRLLGGNKMITVANRFTQVALGNNVQVWGDMKRRVVPSRLVPDVERPERRTGFLHPDLEQWVRANRGKLLAAALTIWRNWDAKGRPKASVTMGSFERWARTVGGALQAAGIPGFLSHTDHWLDNSDQDASEWQEHLAALHTIYGGTQFTAFDVAQLAGHGKLSLPWFKRDPDMPVARALGYRYRAIRDRWLGDLQLVSPGMTNGKARWQIQQRPARCENSENIATDATISTQNHDKPGALSRDGGISRHLNGVPDPATWPEGSVGAAEASQ